MKVQTSDAVSVARVLQTEPCSRWSLLCRLMRRLVRRIEELKLRFLESNFVGLCGRGKLECMDRSL